jgi:hypothetical protein
MTEACRDFREILQQHLDALADADAVCLAAAHKRREILRAAAADAINVSLLKIIARERHFDEEVRQELAEYRDAVTSWTRTPLGQAASPHRAETPAKAKHPSTGSGEQEPEEEELYEEEEREEEEKEGV